MVALCFALYLPVCLSLLTARPFRHRIQTLDIPFTQTTADDASRRRFLSRVITLPAVAPTILRPDAARASQPPAPTKSDWSDVRQPLQKAKDTLQTLLDNWETAVVDCTYADVPRELLAQENKQLLLEKASTFALFDKSVSVVSCKTVVSTVRDYLGRTGIGPMATLESSLQRSVQFALESSSDVDVDQLVQLSEGLQQDLIQADGLSYAARRDFSALNNFEPEESDRILKDPKSNLVPCKRAIQNMNSKLSQILQMLPE